MTALTLTIGQVQLLHCLAEGWDTAGIAEILQCSDAAAVAHLDELFAALGAKNRAHAVALAYSRGYLTTATDLPGVLADVAVERRRQDLKWGQQDHPDGTGGAHAAAAVRRVQAINARRAELGMLTFADILVEEVTEALAETDPVLLRAELVQVAASAVLWIEANDRRLATAIEHHTEEVPRG